MTYRFGIIKHSRYVAGQVKGFCSGPDAQWVPGMLLLHLLITVWWAFDIDTSSGKICWFPLGFPFLLHFTCAIIQINEMARNYWKAFPAVAFLLLRVWMLNVYHFWLEQFQWSGMRAQAAVIRPIQSLHQLRYPPQSVTSKTGAVNDVISQFKL